MKITVIGTGYLGAVHAACMAEIGHDVLGVDVDESKIAALAEGRPPFFEPGLSEVLARTVNSGRLRTRTVDMARALVGGSFRRRYPSTRRPGAYPRPGSLGQRANPVSNA